MSEPMLSVDKLKVVYQRAITALQGISLTVAPGQIVGVLGTNGAGKSTLLRAISGFHGIDDARVTEGSVRFCGRRIENRQPSLRILSPGCAHPRREEVDVGACAIRRNVQVVDGARGHPFFIAQIPAG